jgi:hypothetical protein
MSASNSRVPATVERVEAHTPAHLNERIRRGTVASLDAVGSDPERIERRLNELDREWDVERTLEANAATVALVGLVLGAAVDRRWFLLPGAVATFLLQHAVQGWCPPVPLFRRLGFRTSREIENERAVLKGRRGDFRELPADSDASLRVAER